MNLSSELAFDGGLNSFGDATARRRTNAMITEASFIDFKCPYCGEPVSFPQATAGFSQECPICGEALIVPKDGSDEGRKLPIPITTARLILRRLRTADWTDLHEFLSQDELCKYGGGAPMEEKEIIHWLESDRKVKLTTSDDGFRSEEHT